MAVKSATVVAFCVLSAIVCLFSAQPIDFDLESEQLVLAIEGHKPIPLRVKRQRSYGGVSCLSRRRDCDSIIGVEGTIYENGLHRVDGRGEISKTWNLTGPTTVGGGVEYTGPRGVASVTADHNRQMGTNVGVEGRYNIYSSPNGKTSVDATGGYQRNYGGQAGTSHLDYNVGVELKHEI